MFHVISTPLISSFLLTHDSHLNSGGVDVCSIHCDSGTLRKRPLGVVVDEEEEAVVLTVVLLVGGRSGSDSLA